MEQLLNAGPVQAAIRLWNSLNSTQKFFSTVFVATSIVLLAVVSVVATRPRMGVLFSDLQPNDAGTVVSKLQELKIPYQTEGGGSVVKVPIKDVDGTRLQLASEGLPQSSTVGFEIFDKTSLGMTEFAQRMNYQRALQGELTRTISRLDNVEMAMVHIAIPDSSVFETEEKHPTASIVVRLSPGSVLSPAQVGGVVHLVSSAVEGMKPNYVTVVDTRGNVLSEANDDTGGLNPQISASQSQLKKNSEQEVERNIQSMLERILGPNKAIVRVSAKMDFDQRETSSELYQPAAAAEGLLSDEQRPRETSNEASQPAAAAEGVLTDEQRTEETYGGAGGVGGIAGIPKALKGKSASAGSQSPGYRRVESTTKYQVSKTTVHVVKAPGAVQRLSVAVMLDQKAGRAKIGAIRSAVEAAAGVDIVRGDKVIIESVPFDNTTTKNEEKEMKAAAAKQTYLSLGKNAAGVILLLGFVFFLRGMFKQIKLSAPDLVFGKVPAAAPAGDSLDLGGAAPVGIAAASPVLAEARPEEVAQVVRDWISRS